MTTRTAIVFTMINGLIASCAVLRTADGDSNDGILRGKGLQILDDAGRVRASVQVLRADDGSDNGVLLRLIDTHGRPTVKVGAGERGAALSVCGPSDPGCAVLSAEDRAPQLRFIAQDGHEQVLAP